MLVIDLEYWWLKVSLNLNSSKSPWFIFKASKWRYFYHLQTALFWLCFFFFLTPKKSKVCIWTQVALKKKKKSSWLSITVLIPVGFKNKLWCVVKQYQAEPFSLNAQRKKNCWEELAFVHFCILFSKYIFTLKVCFLWFNSRKGSSPVALLYIQKREEHFNWKFLWGQEIASHTEHCYGDVSLRTCILS